MRGPASPLALALALALPACAVEPGPGAAPVGPPRLTAWTIGPDQPSFTRKLNLIEGARRVAADRPDAAGLTIDVDFATTSHEAYTKKLVFAFASGRAPDIVCGGHELIGQFAAAGRLRPLDADLAARPALVADVFPILWQAMRWRGATYGLPQDNEVRLFYYRTDALRRIGWTADAIAALPGRIERGEVDLGGLAAIGAAVIAGGAIPREQAFFHRNKIGPDWLAYQIAFGGRLEDPATGKLVLSRGAALATFAFFDRLVRGGLTPHGMTSYQERAIYDGFVGGTAWSYLTGGSWNKLEWQSVMDLDPARFARDFGYAPLPGGPAAPGGPRARPVSISHPFACMVSAASRRPDLALEVITRAIDPDLDVRHALGSSHLVVRQSSSRDPAYRAEPFLQDMIGYLAFTHFAPNHAKLPRYTRVLFDAIRGVEVGVLTPAQALDFVVDAERARLGDDLQVEP